MQLVSFGLLSLINLFFYDCVTGGSRSTWAIGNVWKINEISGSKYWGMPRFCTVYPVYSIPLSHTYRIVYNPLSFPSPHSLARSTRYVHIPHAIHHTKIPYHYKTPAFHFLPSFFILHFPFFPSPLSSIIQTPNTCPSLPTIAHSATVAPVEFVALLA